MPLINHRSGSLKTTFSLVLIAMAMVTLPTQPTVFSAGSTDSTSNPPSTQMLMLRSLEALVLGSAAGASNLAMSQTTPTQFSPVPLPALISSRVGIVCAPNPVLVGGSSVCVATVSGSRSNPPPTGNVTFGTNSRGTFTPDACLLIPASLTSSSCPVTYFPIVAGTHSVTASYSGDISFRPSTQTYSIVVELITTSTSVLCIPESLDPSQASICTANVVGSSIVGTTPPAGSISFSSSPPGGIFAPQSCNLTLDASGISSCSAIYQPADSGTQTITGTFGGDPVYGTSQGNSTLSVTLIQTSLVISCTPESILVNQLTSCTSTVTNASPVPVFPAGTVSFATSSSISSIPGCTLESINATQSTCTADYYPQDSGQQTITATYNGDSTHGSTNGKFTLNVTKRTTSTSLSCSPVSALVGQPISCTATVSDTSAGTTIAPTGSVNFSGNATGVFSANTCTPVADSASLGASSCSVTYTPHVTGSYVITGVYQGDEAHAGSNGDPIELFVGYRATSTSLICSPPISLVNGTIQCTVTITDSSAGGTATTPTGVVTFTTNSTGTLSSINCTLGRKALGEASCSTSYTYSLAGSLVVTATYPGDSIHTGSSSASSISFSLGPLLLAPSFVICRPGSLATFKVNATAIGSLTLTAVTSSMPPGAVFTSVTGYGTVIGVFDWVPPRSVPQGNYTISFRASTEGGSSTTKVIVQVEAASKSSDLPLFGSFYYVLIAGVGAAVIVLSERIWRMRKSKLTPTSSATRWSSVPEVTPSATALGQIFGLSRCRTISGRIRSLHSR